MRFWSILIPLLVILPNLLWVKWPPVDPPPLPAEQSPRWRALGALEQIGRMGVFAVPLFYLPRPTAAGFWIVVGVMAVALLTYYLCWLHFFLGGRRYALLFRSLGVLPIPLAVAPVAYFAAAAWLLQSWPMLLAALLLAAGHLPTSYREYRRSL